VEVVNEPELAFERAIERAHPDDAVLVTGSLYLVGDLRRWWRARHPSSHGLDRPAPGAQRQR